MRYLLLVCTEGLFTADPDEMDARPWVTEMDDRGIRLAGNRVRPASDATTVRVRDGDVLVVDGPYAQTREQMAGFDIIDCADLDEAIEVAAKHPMARFGLLELRPFWND